MERKESVRAMSTELTTTELTKLRGHLIWHRSGSFLCLHCGGDHRPAHNAPAEDVISVALLWMASHETCTSLREFKPTNHGSEEWLPEYKETSGQG